MRPKPLVEARPIDKAGEPSAPPYFELKSPIAIALNLYKKYASNIQLVQIKPSINVLMHAFYLNEFLA